MIVSVLLFVLSFLLDVIINILQFLAQDFTLWPSNVLDGLTYFFTQLMNFDFILNVQAMLEAIKFLIAFEIIYVSVTLLLRMFSWVRGSGKLEQ